MLALVPMHAECALKSGLQQAWSAALTPGPTQHKAAQQRTVSSSLLRTAVQQSASSVKLNSSS